jgi:hypothetical protein
MSTLVRRRGCCRLNTIGRRGVSGPGAHRLSGGQQSPADGEHVTQRRWLFFAGPA